MFLDCCQKLARGQMDWAGLGINKIMQPVGQQGAAGNDWVEKLIEINLVQKVDWDDILKSGNLWYDKVVKVTRLPTYRERRVELEALDEEIKRLREQYQGFGALAVLGEKPIATKFTSDMMISLLLPALRQCLNAESRVIQRNLNLKVAFALAEWRTEHDAYPESLQELAPKYLAELPNDLFVEQPLHYERTADGYRLYSVGDNLIDDGGRTFGEMPNADDLVIHVPYRFDPAK